MSRIIVLIFIMSGVMIIILSGLVGYQVIDKPNPVLHWQYIVFLILLYIGALIIKLPLEKDGSPQTSTEARKQ